KNVRVMRYDPRRPHAERYVKDGPAIAPAMLQRVTNDCLTLCRALGYDMNTVEFACEGGVPYAIDFLNPAPDAEVSSVGWETFAWFVNARAALVAAEARKPVTPPKDLHWAAFLKGSVGAAQPAARA